MTGEPWNRRKDVMTLSIERLIRGIYFILKTLVLWASSEIDGSALEFCV